MLYGHLMGGVPVATGEGLPIVETNVWEPGAVGAPWEDKGPWPAE